MKRTTIMIIVSFLVLAVSFVVSACLAEAPVKHKQTIMIYMTGSDLESRHGAASKDIAEMLGCGHDPETTAVIVMTGGSKEWKDYPGDQSVIYEIAGDRLKELYSGELMNMGSPDTLVFFLNYGFEHFPADQYALILWDHGGGPLEGICFDERFVTDGQMDSLSLTELREAFEKSPVAKEPLEWIGFDACLMGSLEVANLCAPYARYMIASQEEEPGMGWDYSFIGKIGDAASGREAGVLIIDGYIEAGTEDGFTRGDLSLSMVDLSLIGETVEKVNEVFAAFSEDLPDNTYSGFALARTSATAIGRSEFDSSDFDLVDLPDMMNVLAQDSLIGKNTEIGGAVIYNRTTIGGLQGLSLYFPYYNRERFRTSWKDVYPEISIGDAYLRFLEKYCAVWLGTPLADWNDLGTPGIETAGDKDIVSIALDEMQIAQMTSASMYVLVERNNEEYLFSSKVNLTEVSSDRLAAIDNHLSLVCFDENGQASEPILYNTVNNRYVVPAVLSTWRTGATSSLETDQRIFVNLYFTEPDEAGRLTFLRAVEQDSDDGRLSGKMDVDLHDYEKLTIIQPYLIITKDQDGNNLPFAQWDRQGYSGYIFDLKDIGYVPDLRFVSSGDTGEPYAYVFEIRDTQGIQHVSKPYSFNGAGSATPITTGQDGTVLFDAEGLYARFVRADLVDGVTQKGIRLWFELKKEKEIEILDDDIVGSIYLNGYRMNESNLGFSYIHIPINTLVMHSVFIEMTEAELAGITQVENITIDTRQQFGVPEHHILMEIIPDEPVKLPQLGVKNEKADQPAELGSAECSNGIRFSLLSIETDEASGNLKLKLLIKNHAENTVRTDNFSLYINDVECGYLLVPELASGTSTVKELTIPARASIVLEPDIPEDTKKNIRLINRFESAGIHEIRSLRFYYHSLLDKEQTEAEMVLDKPYPYIYETDGETQAATFENRVSDDMIDVKLEQVYMDEKGLFLNFMFFNRKDESNILCLKAMLSTGTGQGIAESEWIVVGLPSNCIAYDYTYIPFTSEIKGNELTVTLHDALTPEIVVGEWHIPVRTDNGAVVLQGPEE